MRAVSLPFLRRSAGPLGPRLSVFRDVSDTVRTAEELMELKDGLDAYTRGVAGCPVPRNGVKKGSRTLDCLIRR